VTKCEARQQDKVPENRVVEYAAVEPLRVQAEPMAVKILGLLGLLAILLAGAKVKGYKRNVICVSIFIWRP